MSGPFARIACPWCSRDTAVFAHRQTLSWHHCKHGIKCFGSYRALRVVTHEHTRPGCWAHRFVCHQCAETRAEQDQGQDHETHRN